MVRYLLLAALVSLSAFTTAGLTEEPAGGDLGNVPRKIGREPRYSSDRPLYGLLLFGREGNTRLWLVLDGEVVYLDRNGNGDLTESGERFPVTEIRDQFANHIPQDVFGEACNFRLGDVREAGGRVEHGPLSLTLYRPKAGAMPASPLAKQQAKILAEQREFVDLGVYLRKKHWQTARPRLSLKPEEAPVVHFDGPLTFALASEPVLKRRHENEFRVKVGTPGLGESAFAVLDYEGVVPKDVHPVAEIDFASGVRGPMRQRYVLSHRC
jgi:hypothetical protein